MQEKGRNQEPAEDHDEEQKASHEWNMPQMRDKGIPHR